MDKARLFLVTGIFLSISKVYANASVSNTFDKIYLRIVATANKLAPIREVNKVYTDISLSPKQSSKVSLAIGGGVGYYFNDLYRADLTYENFIIDFDDLSYDLTYLENNDRFSGGKTIKRKGTGSSLMVNFYANFINRDDYQIFVGTGFGGARLKEKVTTLLSGNMLDILTQQSTFVPLAVEHYNSKVIINLSYALMLGINMQVNERINFELIYRWQDYGKVKYLGAMQVRNNRYQGSHISGGLRFNL